MSLYVQHESSFSCIICSYRPLSDHRNLSITAQVPQPFSPLCAEALAVKMAATIASMMKHDHSLFHRFSAAPRLIDDFQYTVNHGGLEIGTDCSGHYAHVQIVS
ncbi:hypothetical protein BS78_05G026100 [Paspalum vaginatum]|nr:hypothetical protein BS78_05G026100 [Paspalum vaginatum]